MTNHVVQEWQYTATVVAVAMFAPTWVQAFVANTTEQEAVQAFCFGQPTAQQVRTAEQWVRECCNVEPTQFYVVAHEAFGGFQAAEAARETAA